MSSGPPATTDSPGSALRRRAVTIPRTYLALALLTALLPLLSAAALAVDVARRAASGLPFTALKLLAFTWFYLFLEAVMLPWLGVQWLAAGVDRAARPGRLQRSAAASQRAWVAALFACARWLVGLRVELEGDDAIEPGPVLVLIRHTSVVDVLLPTMYVTDRHKILLRFVLKRELLADPCLDIAGHRLRNHFVGRGGADTDREIAAVRELARDLGPGDGVLIYPEGTRFSQARRQRLLLTADQALRARAEALTHVLPPRLGGTLALLESAPTVDVLFIAHRGLEGVTTLADAWSGALNGCTVHMKVWRVPAREIPRTRGEQVEWLHAQWAKVNEFAAGPIDRRSGARTGAG